MKILIKLRPFAVLLILTLSARFLEARVLKYYMLIGDDVEITWFVF